MPLDMFQQTQADTDAYVQRNNAPRLPATFSDTFAAAWNENQFFGQSIAGRRARYDAVSDAADDLYQKTGEAAFHPAVVGGNLDQLNEQIRATAGKRPDLDLQEVTPDAIDRAAVAKSRMARADYEAMQAREKTFGGKFGALLGGAAGTATDPVNLVVAPLAAPEGLGLLATSMAWAGIAGGSQAAIEAIGSPYRDQVQPGYSQSGEPAANILGAAAFGGATGGAFKGLGMAWSRAKTGVWPRSIRDAGNVVESEANVAQTNVMPGLEGGVAHREALTKTIDDIVAGRKVEVPDDVVAPHEARLDGLMAERSAARGATEEAAAARVTTEPAPELPFDATATEAKAEAHEATLADGVQGMARQAGYDMPREEAARIAKLVNAAKTDDDARAILSTVADRPQTVADLPPTPAPKPPTVMAAPEVTPKQAAEMIGSPEHAEAVRADIDRARATGDVKIPAGVDENGEPVFRSLDSAMDEVDAYKAAADQIKACANPQPEPAGAA